MDFLDELRIILEADSVGTFGVDLFMSTQAVIPVLASGLATLQVTETQGLDPEYIQNTIRPRFVNPFAQLVARANDYETAKTKADDAYDSLAAVWNRFVVDQFGISGWYRWIKPLQEPFDGGVEPSTGQARCVFNVMANKRP